LSDTQQLLQTTLDI